MSGLKEMWRKANTQSNNNKDIVDMFNCSSETMCIEKVLEFLKNFSFDNRKFVIIVR